MSLSAAAGSWQSEGAQNFVISPASALSLCTYMVLKASVGGPGWKFRCGADNQDIGEELSKSQCLLFAWVLENSGQEATGIKFKCPTSYMTVLTLRNSDTLSRLMVKRL